MLYLHSPVCVCVCVCVYCTYLYLVFMVTCQPELVESTKRLHNYTI